MSSLRSTLITERLTDPLSQLDVERGAESSRRWIAIGLKGDSVSIELTTLVLFNSPEHH